MKISDNRANRWYSQPAMLVVTAVLVTTLVSGVTMLIVAASGNDPLVVSEHEYQEIRDDFRLTEPREKPTQEHGEDP